jgi:dTDP-glucose 4,6-dehydratase
VILVTGGAGFIGSNFVLDWLAGANEAIVNLDCLTHAGNLENLKTLEGDTRHVFVRGDIGDDVLVKRLFEVHSPRAVVHFAAESHVDRSIQDPGAFVRTNVDGTCSLLEASRRHFNGLTDDSRSRFRFIQVSTDEVYGSLAAAEPAFTELSPHAPNNPYAASKAAGDQLARAWRCTFGLPVITMHCGNNYGPFQFPEKLIPLVILNALEGRQLPLYGDGQNVRDWLFVSDHCAAIRDVLKKGRPGEVYNVGSRNERKNIEVVTTVCTILDELRPKSAGSYADQIAYVKDRPGHDRRYAIDSSKIETEIGWRPSVTFESGLRQTVQWYLDHPAWVGNVKSGAYRQWIERQYGATA